MTLLRPPAILYLLVQWITVATNIPGLLLVCDAYRAGDTLSALLFATISVLSMLIHLSETKHGLPGIAPFKVSTLTQKPSL